MLRDAVSRPREYVRELEALQVYSADDNYITQQLVKLKKNARSGVSSVGDLQHKFAEISEKILKKSLLEKQDKSLFNKVAIKFSGMVHIRKVSADATSKKPVDIVARSEAALVAGDVALALTELDKLPDTDKSMMASWVILADDYVTAQIAAEDILRYVTRPSRHGV